MAFFSDTNVHAQKTYTPTDEKKDKTTQTNVKR